MPIITITKYNNPVVGKNKVGKCYSQERDLFLIPNLKFYQDLFYGLFYTCLGLWGELRGAYSVAVSRTHDATAPFDCAGSCKIVPTTNNANTWYGMDILGFSMKVLWLCLHRFIVMYYACRMFCFVVVFNAVARSSPVLTYHVYTSAIFALLKYPVLFSSAIQALIIPVCFSTADRACNSTGITPGYIARILKNLSASCANVFRHFPSKMGDPFRLAVLLSRQHSLNPQGSYNTKPPSEYSCLDVHIIPRFTWGVNYAL